LEQILTETDAPYHLIDSPKRFILPEDVVIVSNQIALLKDVQADVLANQVMRNIRDLFRV
jgi:Tat protein secretion system quality control protein TatD with DNase activity